MSRGTPAEIRKTETKVRYWQAMIRQANDLIAPVMKEMEDFSNEGRDWAGGLPNNQWTEEQSAVAGVAGFLRTATNALANLSVQDEEDEFAPMVNLRRRLQHLRENPEADR